MERIRFSDDFVNKVLERIKEIYERWRSESEAEKQTLSNRKTAVELRLHKTEEKLLSGVLKDDDFARLRDRFKQQLSRIDVELFELREQHNNDMDILAEAVRLMRSVPLAYQKAPHELKRQYLCLFFDKILVENKRIVKVLLTPLVQNLIRKQKVRLRGRWCPQEESNLQPLG